MTYDFHGSWENVARHHSPLYSQDGADSRLSTKAAIDYWIQQGAPPHKVNITLIGFPVY